VGSRKPKRAWTRLWIAFLLKKCTFLQREVALLHGKGENRVGARKVTSKESRRGRKNGKSKAWNRHKKRMG